MVQVSGMYTIGGLIMMLFLSACAAAGGKDAEGPLPSVRDRLASAVVPVSRNGSRSSDDDIPVAG